MILQIPFDYNELPELVDIISYLFNYLLVYDVVQLHSDFSAQSA